PRLCRLICSFPTSADVPSRLFGKILNFNFASSPVEGKFYFGVDFGENEEADRQRLEQFLRSKEDGDNPSREFLITPKPRT
ncbi:hypothetical protein HYR69_01955, partial [Candidatus Sumerlaeota bacterium]|nr:hypothetical protein [Candidatus Sumerlaeota bacterium]